MNYSKSLILLTIMLILLPCGLLAFNNEPDGYDGIQWGTGISTLKNMKYVKTDPSDSSLVIYTKEGDAFRLGNAILKSSEYGFIDGKFSFVTMKVENLFNYVALKDAVIEKFGEGTGFDQHSERYYWDGSTTRITLVSAFDLS